MFNNIGKKIKDFSVFLTWIGIIASVIVGIIFILYEDLDDRLGYLIIVLGALVSWISSWLLYGFGELIENTSIIARKIAADEFQDDQEPNDSENQTDAKSEKISPGAIVIAIVAVILFVILVITAVNLL